MNTTCNGYTNWDTFIVCLYSDNEECFYDLKNNMLRRFQHIDKLTPANARYFSNDSGLSRFCRDNEDAFTLSNVDWHDVADSWTSELVEFKAYNA